MTSKWAKGSGGPSGSETGNMVLDTAETVDFGRTSDRIRIGAETAATLQAGGGGAGANTGLYMVPQAFRKSARAQSSDDGESWVEDGQANTLNVFDVGDTRTTHAIVEGVSYDGMNQKLEFGVHRSLRIGRDSSDFVVQPDVEPTLAAHETGQGWWTEADYAGTLRAEGENRPSRPSNVMMQQYGVRRLTPVECERLQSFPDGWTEPAGSDSARYKAMGNAVTVNVVRWILGRLP